MLEEWLEDFQFFGIDWKKFFLEIVFYLIVIFKKLYDLVDGEKKKNYYVNEFVGLVVGFLFMAIYNVGFVVVIYMLSFMNFFYLILKWLENECVFLFIFVGYLGEEVKVFDIDCKVKDEVLIYYF